AASSGKYIAFLDSDDACAVNRLQVQLDFLKEHPDVHATACEAHDINNFHPGFVGTAGTRVLWNAGGAYKPVGLLKVGQGLNGLLGQSTFITKESFLAIGGYRPHDTIIEDMDFTLRYSGYSAEYSAAHSHQLGKWAFMAGASLYLYAFPSNQKTSGLSNADPLKFAKRHIACYISQWCDYKGLPDPVAENKGLEEILKITESIPWRAKYLIFASASHLHGGIMVTQEISLNQSRGLVLDLLSYPWVIKQAILLAINLIINLKNLLRPLKPWVSPLLRKLRLLKTT
nr:glycosyltransferase family 2 protein [Gammaproteobacteria bacterium]